MNVRRVLIMIVLVLLALDCAAAPAARAGDGESKPWTRIEFVAGDARTEGPRSFTLHSSTEAELVPSEGALPVKGVWSLFLAQGSILRFVSPDRSVRWFAVDGYMIADITAGGEMVAKTAAASVRETLGRRRCEARVSEGFGGAARQDILYLHPDGTADWGVWKSNSVVAVVPARPADGTLVLTFPDKTSKSFRRDGTAWVETASGERFESCLERDMQTLCESNLKRLGRLFMDERTERPGKPSYDGVALLLSWRVRGKRLTAGQEGLLRCPSDPALRTFDDATLKAYDTVDLRSPPLDLCSYAFRDFTRFPLKVDSERLQIIGCCRQGKDGRTPHHAGGLCVLFDDGSARFVDREELGLKPDEPIVVGPDSKVEMLRMVVQVPKR